MCVVEEVDTEAIAGGDDNGDGDDDGDGDGGGDVDGDGDGDGVGDNDDYDQDDYYFDFDTITTQYNANILNNNTIYDNKKNRTKPTPTSTILTINVVRTCSARTRSG